MPEVKYGELASWGDGDVSSPNDFLTLAEGDNLVRVFTNPYQFIVHWTKDSTGSQRKIRCSIQDCPLCKRGVKTQTRWYVGVLDRKTSQTKILEIGSQIYKGIKDYIMSSQWGKMFKHPWGDVMAYDINIKRGPKGTQPLYTIMGTPDMSDLSVEEAAMVENFLERVSIVKFTQPPTPEEVAEKVGLQVASASPSTAGQQYNVGGQNVVQSEVGVRPTISDDDFDFGDDEL